jgi:hypothetical protein
MEQPRDNRENGSDRSIRSFDPVSGLKAVAEIQAEGLHAAGALLERVIGAEPDYGGARPRSRAPDYRALVDAWTELLTQTLAGLAPHDPGAELTVQVDGRAAAPLVRLDGAEVEVWLRNDGREDAGPISLFAGPLVDADGAVLEGAEIGFEPREVPLLPARSSRAVTLSLVAADGARPGTYGGTVQARGAPALWIPLEVVIAGS